MNFKLYDLGTTVRIAALAAEAKVLMVRYSGLGLEYYVAYWFNGDRCEEWLLDCELESCDSNPATDPILFGLMELARARY